MDGPAEPVTLIHLLQRLAAIDKHPRTHRAYAGCRASAFVQLTGYFAGGSNLSAGQAAVFR